MKTLKKKKKVWSYCAMSDNNPHQWTLETGKNARGVSCNLAVSILGSLIQRLFKSKGAKKQNAV